MSFYGTDVFGWHQLFSVERTETKSPGHINVTKSYNRIVIKPILFGSFNDKFEI